MKNLARRLADITRKNIIAGLMAAIAMPTAGYAEGTDPGVTPSQITIGSCCALTGPASQLGTQQLTGATAYLNYVNDSGGVNGRKIVIKRYDDGYEPTKAASAFKSLLADKCFAGAFFVGTPTGKVYVPLAEENKVPIVGLFTGAQFLHEPFKPHIISVRASYYDEMREQIDHMFKDMGNQKVGIIYQNDPFGSTVLEGLKKALAAHNATPVAEGTFERNTTDVAAGIEKVKAAKPNVVVVVGPYKPVSEVLKRAHAGNWNPIFTTVSFVGTEELISAAGKDAEGTVISQVVSPYNRDDLPTVQLYKKQLQKYFPNEKPTYVGFEGFVDAMVLVDGLKGAGKNLTRAKLISALEAIHNKDMGLGPNLKLTYGPARHKGFDSVYTTVIKNGQAVAFFNWKQVQPKH